MIEITIKSDKSFMRMFNQVKAHIHGDESCPIDTKQLVEAKLKNKNELEQFLQENGCSLVIE